MSSFNKPHTPGVSYGANNVAQTAKLYSMAEVQLTNGEMVGMMITAGPTLGQHLTQQMAKDGYLYLYNDNESLIIKADNVATVKLTKMTQG